ncbi:MAG: hypothetical protein IT236_09830 [Bacteroidia bacterium]|nr:hypothetical protein [Bacteroidia bacterium]
MKNSETEELPRLNLERDRRFLATLVLLCAILGYVDYLLFNAFNPLGFLVLIPAGLLSFQTLWLLLRPFAEVFDDRFEIKQSLFSNKINHFIDIKKVSENKKGELFITYKDDEVEKLKLFGIRKADIALLKEEIEKNIRL